MRADNAYTRAMGVLATGDIAEQMSFAWTADKALTDCLMLRAEGRYDLHLSNSPLFAIGRNVGGGTGSRNGQLVGVLEIHYAD